MINRLFIAKKLIEAANELSILGERAEVPRFIWESLKKVFGKNVDGSTFAKHMIKKDANGNLVGNKDKCKGIAIGQHSIEKKLEELGHGEIKARFSDANYTFDNNARLLGIDESEYTKYIEPPEDIIEDIIKSRIEGKGDEVKYTKRAPAGGRSKVNLDEIGNHAAIKQFNEKFIDPIKDAGIKINVSYVKSNNDMGVIEDIVKVVIPKYDIKIMFEVITKGSDSRFIIDDWSGPYIESQLRLRSIRPMNELENILDDIKKGKIKGSIYTSDGRNVLNLSEDEIKEYFESEDISMEDKIKILKARLSKGKKDHKVATIVLELLSESGDLNSDEANDFIANFENVLDWSYISKYIKLPDAIMKGYSDKLDWKWISTSGDLTDDFVLEFADKLNIQDVIDNQSLSKKTLKELNRRGLID